MRELILKKIKQAFDNEPDEIVEQYGKFKDIEKMSLNSWFALGIKVNIFKDPTKSFVLTSGLICNMGMVLVMLSCIFGTASTTGTVLWYGVLLSLVNLLFFTVFMITKYTLTNYKKKKTNNKISQNEFMFTKGEVNSKYL